MEAALWRHALADLARTRGKIFSHYARFARAIARDRYLSRRPDNYELGDVEQFAYEGLLQAIDRFEPLRAMPFRAFARPRIAGSIANGLGKYSEAGANAAYRRRAERDRLKSLMAEMPEDGGSALQQLSKLAATLAIGLIIEEWRQEEVEQVRASEPTAYDTLAWKQTELALRDSIAMLPANEAFIVQQHYLNGVAFRQIALILGLSNGRVSQLHSRALGKLHKQMAKSR
ncbi:hypothetical protein ATE62_04380 [Sphingopyxis sp. HIX]|nr:hypothetical protein ATE62_04380 [Sphingopyxis sp. HIX]KTE85218.1 hypothetical protein ATE72_04985 [Sphingopyxis sp. HXXIV]